MRWTSPGLAGILLILGSSGTAHAYLDPGVGSIVLQVILGALAALLVMLKLYWHRLLRLLGIGRNKSDGSATEGTSEPG